MHRAWKSAALLPLAAALAAAPALARDAGGDIKKAMKEKTGTYYLKTNLPYLQGRHAYGTFKRPIVTVSPGEGVTTASTAEVQGGAFHAEGRRLTLRVNDPVKVDEHEWESDDQSLEIELEGTGQAKDGVGVIKFVGLAGVNDFEACWEAAFSSVPLQDKYDWPADIKRAVAERRVLEGMTQEQVVVAVGYPEKTSTSTDQGHKVETWVIQRGEGSKMGFWTMKVGDKQEMEIRFVDGKVAQIGGSQEQPKVKLK
ncbi:MAG TPA: hypothetical protein VJV23_00805 [Candidatus Polarisedimenticolia bacterium]|nr:hypothetical protein [Candidatus Polarisedimenticolia bacterium]